VYGYRCNGFSELCNKKFNEVAFIQTHNSSSNKTSLVQNQDRSITQQLVDGVRAMKVPVHNNYGNLLGYYYQSLLRYKNILEKALDIMRQEARSATRALEKEAQVTSLDLAAQELVIDKSIEQEKKDYYNLPSFSLTEKSQFSESGPFAYELAKLQAEKAALVLKAGGSEVSKDIATTFVVPVEAVSKHPESILLTAELELVNAALWFIEKTAHDQQDLIVQPYACHGVAKTEFYQNYVSKMIDNAPSQLKPILQRMQNPLSNLEDSLKQQLFGEKNEFGESGIFPYPTCLLDAGRKSLVDVLTEVRDFLDKNPYEVLMIMLEDHDVDSAQIAQAVEKSGIKKYAHVQDSRKPWPALGTMIKTNKRMVIFTGTDMHARYPWLNFYDAFSGWNTHWGMSKVEDFAVPFDAALEIKNYGFYDDKPPYNKFLQYGNSITPVLAGDIDSARQVNARSIARQRALDHAQATHHIPNFISVDFYEYPTHDGVSDIFDVRDEINGVGKYAGKPLWRPQKTQKK
jgi:hypothetical protein